MPNSNEARQERAARLAADPSIRPHGNLNTYSNWGCTCPECTAANAAYRASLKAQRTADDFSSAPPSDVEYRRAYARKMGWDVKGDDDGVI